MTDPGASMDDMNVKQLGVSLGVSSDDLLAQIVELGWPQRDEEEPLSMDQARDLIASVTRQRSQGETPSGSLPRKITLSRRATRTLKPSKGGRGVRVEMRKRRTYVRSGADEKAIGELTQPEMEVQQPIDRERLEQEERSREDMEERARLAEEQNRAEATAAKDRLAEQERREREQAEAVEAAADVKPADTQPTEPGAAELAQVVPITQPSQRPRVRERQRKDKEKTVKLRRPGSADRGAGRDASRGRDAGTRRRISLSGRSRRRPSRAPLVTTAHGGEFSKPIKEIVREVELADMINVGELAKSMSVKAGELIRTLMGMGVMATINQVLDRDTAALVVEEMGHKVKLVTPKSVEDKLAASLQVDGEEVMRSPVVTVMGHVDHGKTSLLDYLRKTKVVEGEAGGITQHIGAYRVQTPQGAFAFLDTPGHAAFTEMRARGANVTDIVVLVCAADDGVMPQTQEAVQHAKAAKVPIVVAVNKMDLKSADPDRVRTELGAIGVTPEEWGGDTQFVNMSAATGDGIDDLLAAIALQADLLELKAVAEAPGQGVVVESRLERGRGAVCTVLVQNGTLKQGDVVVAGEHYGKARALIDDHGNRVRFAGPAHPVEMLGLNGTPNAGDSFSVAPDDRQARQVAADRSHALQKKQIQMQQAARLETVAAGFQANEKRVLKMIIKADVRGSLEAIVQGCNEIGNEEVAVNILGSGVGAITESDINMALTYGAAIFGFNVRTDKSAKGLVEQHRLDVRYYNVIYELIDDVRSLLEDMLVPEIREEILGTAEVRDVFRSPRFGAIAGCLVLDGTMYRHKKIRVLRDSTVIYEGELESLRRFKDDVSEVRNGLECGIGVRNYNDVRNGDLIEVFESREVARAL